MPERAAEVGEQMDHLRGAFGGLSDNHHRILVLREFEGLSYHEIGERMGLTRPSVESTLFRARRRLGEEYADVQTGRRCDDVREALGPVAGGIAGARERRRVQRHLAWCSSCRSAARRAGLENGEVLVPEGVGSRAAALLPLPALPSIVFDPAASWFKATAVALGLAAASTGASLAVYAVPDKPLHKPLAPHIAVPAPRRAGRVDRPRAPRPRARSRAAERSPPAAAAGGPTPWARRPRAEPTPAPSGLVAGPRPGLVPSRGAASRPTVDPAAGASDRRLARPGHAGRRRRAPTGAVPRSGRPERARPVRPVADQVGHVLRGLPDASRRQGQRRRHGRRSGRVLSTADAAAAQASGTDRRQLDSTRLGAWRSLVARTVRVGEVPSSNLGAPM